MQKIGHMYDSRDDDDDVELASEKVGESPVVNQQGIRCHIVVVGVHTFDGKRTWLKGRSAHVGSSHWHRRHGSKIGPVVGAVRVRAVVIAAVPLQGRDATVIPDHHAASLVLSSDSGTILLFPARRGARQCIDCGMCWDMPIGNGYLIRGLFGNRRLVLVGSLFRSPDLGEDGHDGESDEIQEIGTSVVVENSWHDGPLKLRSS